jgi:NAD(P)-dependent dehydrogenase (short-subunit alcohol dehydrogenase family)
MTAMGLPNDVSDKFHDKLGRILPAGRSGLPTDIGDSILYLASDHAAFVTGTNLLSDGGAVAANQLTFEF